MGWITQKPSIENVDPVAKYQRSTPQEFSLQEKPVLYGGGRNWLLRAGDERILPHSLRTPSSETHTVDLFVSSSSLVIWFNDADKGLEIAYRDIVLHAIQNSAAKRELYLQIGGESDDEIIEAYLHPGVGVAPGDGRADDLFDPENFGRRHVFVEDAVQSTYDAISHCSSLHFDTDSDNEDVENVPSVPLMHEMTLNSSGEADDLDSEISVDGDTGAAVEVELPGCAVVRPRGDENLEAEMKKRKTQ